MGAYSQLRIGRRSIVEEKHWFDARLLLLFRQEDFRMALRKPDEEEFGRYHACQYAGKASEIADRLDLMGFSLERSIEEFDHARVQLLKANADSELSGAGKADLRQFLKRYSYHAWLRVMKRVFGSRTLDEMVYVESKPPHVRSVTEFVLSYRYLHYGFLAEDPRYFLRACLSIVDPTTAVALDLAELANHEEFEPDPKLFENTFARDAAEYSRTMPTIILTEGSSDTWILRESLAVIYPHLCGWFSFMDFDSVRAPGGVGHLINAVKSFAGSGIRNRILAVLDNDTAARAALNGLDQTRLPPNIGVCPLPVVKSLRRYPTVGPGGFAYVDINGLAGSIELYLGVDVLGTGKKRIPVRWTGFDRQLNCYQGEISEKSAIHERFRKKLQLAARERIEGNSAWSDLREVWATIRGSAERLGHAVTDSALLM
jgi:hypothetical protein